MSPRASRLAILATLAAQLPSSYAWGNVGHETIAYIAQSFVASSTKSFCQGILGDTSTSYLANVATWADSYRYTSAGRWSEPLHFIDANDNPPSSCSVEYKRDCGDTGCVVSAIRNYVSLSVCVSYIRVVDIMEIHSNTCTRRTNCSINRRPVQKHLMR
jgi:hypothetical protein